MPNLNLTTNEHLVQSVLNGQQYRTKLSLNVSDHSFIDKPTLTVRI
jgi:hypothetical protein